MGKKSGPPAPPPPPDYTEDRQRAVETENTRRADIAKKYNTAIGSFNEQFGGFGGTLSEYEDTISGLSLGDDLSGLDTISDDLRKLDRDFEAFADGDVSFLEAYDPNKKVKENKERYQADLAAYEEKYADPIKRYRDDKNEKAAAAAKARREAMEAAGIDPNDPGAAFAFAKQNDMPLFDLPSINLTGEFSSGFVDPLTGERIEAGPSLTDYGGFDFGAMAANLSTLGLEFDENGVPIDPGFQAAGTEFGGAVAYDMPTLDELDIKKADRYMSRVDDLEELIAALQGEESAEQSRIADFFDDYISRANQGDIDVEFADLNTDFSRYDRQLAEARKEIDEFDSVLGFTDQRDAALAELTALEELIAGRVAEQTAEQGRVDTAQEAAQIELEAIEDVLNDLGIAGADAETVKALYDRLDTQADALRDFESDLDFSFGNEVADITDLEDMLYGIETDRALEERRIADLTKDFGTRSAYLDRIADRTDRFDLENIEDIQDALAALETEIGGTTSELATDFSGATDTIGTARTALSDLLTAREGDLQGIRDTVAELISGREDDLTTEDIDESIRSLADIAEYDEAGLMSRREEIERELARLSDYTGGGTGDTTTAINDALDAVDQRLRDLGGSRSGIEQDALTALQDIRNREYFTSADVDAARDEVELIRQRAETFGATQAADELEALTQVLTDQSARLAGDADAVAAREARGRAEVEAMLDAYGNIQFPQVGDAQQLMSEDQLRAFLAEQSEDDELLNLRNQSAFVTNLLGAA